MITLATKLRLSSKSNLANLCCPKHYHLVGCSAPPPPQHIGLTEIYQNLSSNELKEAEDQKDKNTAECGRGKEKLLWE